MSTTLCTKINCKELEDVKMGLRRVIECVPAHSHEAKSGSCERTPIQQECIDTFVKNALAYIGHPGEKL